MAHEDHDFWTQKSNYLSSWARRAKSAAALCPDRWVCDIGCGMEVLRSFLPRSTIYLPADLKQWHAGVELCDLDAGKMPEHSLRLCDVCVMLGVIEHLGQPRDALRAIAEEAEYLVISYNAAALRLTQDRWKNALSVDELQDIIAAAGYRVTESKKFERQTILRAVNEGFDEAKRARRAAARSAYRPSPSTLWSELKRAAHRLRALRPVGSDRSARRTRRA